MHLPLDNKACAASPQSDNLSATGPRWPRSRCDRRIVDGKLALAVAVPEQTSPISGVRRALQAVELFTGAGGLALGTLKAGFHHKYLVEWDHDACRTLRTNVIDPAVRSALPGIDHWAVVEGDVRDIHKINFVRLTWLDMIAGGPPCQPFSIGGKHRGMRDDRDMLPQFVRAIREARPRAFILENVRGLLRPAFQPYFEYILLQLKYPDLTRKDGEDWITHQSRLLRESITGRAGYQLTYQLVNAADYGVPQVRNRVVVVGFRSDLGLEPAIPAPTHSRKVLEFEQRPGGEYWERHRLLRPSSGSANQSIKIGADVPPALNPWKTVRDAIADLPSPSLGTRSTAPFSGHWVQPGARSYVGHSGSDYDLPAKTLKAGDHGVPGGENMLRKEDGSIRYFTVREMARLQTFPDEWNFEGAWSETMRQLGNAVPVQLATVIARAVATHL